MATPEERYMPASTSYSNYTSTDKCPICHNILCGCCRIGIISPCCQKIICTICLSKKVYNCSKACKKYHIDCPFCKKTSYIDKSMVQHMKIKK